MEFIIIIFFSALIFGAIGSAIGELGGKNNGKFGAVLGALLGPIGCIIAAVIPASEASPAAMKTALPGNDQARKIAEMEAQLAKLKKELGTKEAARQPLDADSEIPTYRLD